MPPIDNRPRRTFRVASVSDNTNSFGLTGMVLIAKSGEAWEVGASSLAVKKKGEDLTVPIEPNGDLDWASRGLEIARRLQPDCPPKALAEIFQKEASTP